MSSCGQNFPAAFSETACLVLDLGIARLMGISRVILFHFRVYSVVGCLKGT